jgi:hypothetical protein
LSSAQGRWTSPDWSAKPETVPYGDLSNPQTLNLYGYVKNNPLSLRDDDGHDTLESPMSRAEDEQRTKETVKFFGNEIIGVGKLVFNMILATGDVPQEGYAQPTNLAQKIGYGVGAVAAVVSAFAGDSPGETAQVTKNAAKGAASEARVLNDIGEVKNTQSVSTAEGRSIPDFQNTKVVGEVKDAKTVSNTKQLRIQKEAAQQSGRQHELHTGTKTNVTNNATQGTRVIRRDDLGPR